MIKKTDIYQTIFIGPLVSAPATSLAFSSANYTYSNQYPRGMEFNK